MRVNCLYIQISDRFRNNKFQWHHFSVFGLVLNFSFFVLRIGSMFSQLCVWLFSIYFLTVALMDLLLMAVTSIWFCFFNVLCIPYRSDSSFLVESRICVTRAHFRVRSMYRVSTFEIQMEKLLFLISTVFLSYIYLSPFFIKLVQLKLIGSTVSMSATAVPIQFIRLSCILLLSVFDVYSDVNREHASSTNNMILWQWLIVQNHHSIIYKELFIFNFIFAMSWLEQLTISFIIRTI